jgi:hypothetical protein
MWMVSSNKEIRASRTVPLTLSNLLQLDRFEEDLFVEPRLMAKLECCVATSRQQVEKFSQRQRILFHVRWGFQGPKQPVFDLFECDQNGE